MIILNHTTITIAIATIITAIDIIKAITIAKVAFTAIIKLIIAKFTIIIVANRS